MDIILLVINDEVLMNKWNNNKKIIEQNNIDKYMQFKNLILSRKDVYFFEDTKDIKFQIASQLNIIGQNNNLSGWIKVNKNNSLFNIKNTNMFFVGL